MKKRNIVAVILLTLVTFGIYGVYWVYATRKELVTQEHDPKAIPSFGWLLLPLLLTPLLLIPIFLMIPDAEAQQPPLWTIFLPILTILIVGFGYTGLYCWWFYHYCKVATRVAKGIEFMPAYILFLLTTFLGFPLLWEVLMQNDFNNAADRLSAKKESGKAAKA